MRCRKLCSTFVIPVSHLHQGGCSAILAVNYDVGVKRYFAPSDTELLRALHSRNSKNIRNSLIFLQKMATYSCLLRVPSSKILLQASLRRISDLDPGIKLCDYLQTYEVTTMKYQIKDGTVTLGGETILSHIDFEIQGNQKNCSSGKKWRGKDYITASDRRGAESGPG